MWKTTFRLSQYHCATGGLFPLNTILNSKKGISLKEFEIKTMSVFYDDEFQLHVRDLIKSGGVRIKVTKIQKNRSIPQNSSMHDYLSDLATILDDAGFDQKVILDKFQKGFSVPVTSSFMKDIFRECGLMMFGKKSTADLTTVEIQKVYEAFGMRISQETGYHSDWPAKEEPPSPER